MSNKLKKDKLYNTKFWQVLTNLSVGLCGTLENYRSLVCISKDIQRYLSINPIYLPVRASRQVSYLFAPYSQEVTLFLVIMYALTETVKCFKIKDDRNTILVHNDVVDQF